MSIMNFFLVFVLYFEISSKDSAATHGVGVSPSTASVGWFLNGAVEQIIIIYLLLLFLYLVFSRMGYFSEEKS
jgi:hypothetical protein